MTFTWPFVLPLLVLVPALAVGYRRLVGRAAGRRTALAELGVAGSRPGRRRHVAPVMMLAALALLLVALARPQATVAEPRREGTVVLAFDVSTSMAATDARPTRLEAAKSLARRFVAAQPARVRIAVVAFGEGGFISQRPTADHDAVLTAIGSLTPQGGTTIGRGIQLALSAIVGHTVELGTGPRTDDSVGPDLGYHSSASVVLLTDGEDTGGPDPTAAAELASTAGVRVYPVGLGSRAGSTLAVGGFQIATSLDEQRLRGIADTTDGRYLDGSDPSTLQRLSDAVRLAWTTTPVRIELTALLAGAAALLLLAGTALSVTWFGRVV